jgi:FAD synthetase
MKKNDNLKKVMAFGTFDAFHAGHENYLRQAKELGDYLMVIIARDDTVKKIKGNRPLHAERQRLASVKASGIADKVILGYHGDKYKVIHKYRPDIIALGYDQFVFTQRLKKTLIDIKLDATVVRLTPYFPQIYKSSLIKKAALEMGNIHGNLEMKTSPILSKPA